jgi:hypothetical protein
MRNFIYLYKRTAAFLGLVVLIAFIPGCDDFLEEAPKSNITTENFFQSDQDAIAAVNGIYSALKTPNMYGQEYWYYVHIGTDIAAINPGENNEFGQAASRYTINPTTTRIGAIWAQYYDGIARANSTIQNVSDNGAINPDIATRVVGEAKFLRALFYFNLVRTWGGVPVVTEVFNSPDEISDFVRNSEEEVYSQILADLKDAETALPESYSGEDVGRATSGATSTLLGNAYLQKKDWDSAVSKLGELIGEYALMPSYQELFYSRNENGSESIFEVQNQIIPGSPGTVNWQGHIIHTTFGSPEVPAGERGSGWASVIPTQEFSGSYELDDIRQDVTLYDSWTTDDTVINFVNGPYINKYQDAPDVPYSGIRQTDMNFVILRYADVLLMYAEALNEKNNGPNQEAYDVINQVRARAELTDLPQGLTKEQFSDAILQERAWELAYEGHRRFDLVRFGKLVEAVKSTSASNPVGAANVQDFHQLWPIPQEVIDESPGIEQNPGY